MREQITNIIDHAQHPELTDLQAQLIELLFERRLREFVNYWNKTAPEKAIPISTVEIFLKQ